MEAVLIWNSECTPDPCLSHFVRLSDKFIAIDSLWFFVQKQRMSLLRHEVEGSLQVANWAEGWKRWNMVKRCLSHTYTFSPRADSTTWNWRGMQSPSLWKLEMIQIQIDSTYEHVTYYEILSDQVKLHKHIMWLNSDAAKDSKDSRSRWLRCFGRVLSQSVCLLDRPHRDQTGMSRMSHVGDSRQSASQRAMHCFYKAADTIPAIYSNLWTFVNSRLYSFDRCRIDKF